nr:hypothetical protein [Tanacetum cinerariifolium]
MRIEQYIQMMDYALWDVIENGPTLPKTQVVEGVTSVMPITSVEDKAQRRLEVKVRILQESHEKAKTGQKRTREQKEYTRASNLSSKVNQSQLWNKTDIDTMSMDDLYNNLKVYEPEVKGMSSSTTSIQNMAFVSSSNNNSTDRAVNTAQAVNTAIRVSTGSTQVNTTNIDNLSDVVICAFLASQLSSPQLANEDLEQIHPHDLEEMDLKWQMAMLIMRARRFLKKTGRKLTANGSKKSRYQAQGSTRRTVLVETPASTTLVSCDRLGGYDWSDQAEECLNFALMAYTSSSSKSKVSTDSTCTNSCLESVKILKSQNEQLTKDLKNSGLMVLGYKTGLDEFANMSVVENSEAESSQEKPKEVRKNTDVPIIEEWMSDDEDKEMIQPKFEQKTVKTSIAKIKFVKSKQLEKKARKIVKRVENPRKNTHRHRCNQRN